MLHSLRDIQSPTSQQRMKWGFISVLVSCTFSILPRGCQGSNLQLNLENIQQKKKVKTFGARVSGEAPSKFTSIILQSVDIANMCSCTFFLEVPGSAIDFVTKNNNCLLKASNQRLQASLFLAGSLQLQ